MAEITDPRWSHLWDNEESFDAYSYPLREDAVTDPKLWEDIPPEALKRIGPFMTTASPDTHVGPFLHAVDFLVLDGNQVLAAQDGQIIEVVQDNDKWGDGEEFAGFLNYVTIRHPGDGSYTQYCHLAKGSVRATGYTRGDWVSTGSVIGTVGKCGWTDRDHLHFIIYRSANKPENPFGFKSLVPRWRKSN